ncbi:MAG: hypothetical protein NW215_00515 [Hyphomicrobiales bacterium]|nr:hypothetical protein [Hyphomicrobiales bacterium]
MTTSSNLPSHRALVNLGNEDQKVWREVGAAWPHNDGQGFTLKLDLIPTAGLPIILRATTNQPHSTDSAA